MKLFYRTYGQGKPLIILHGLFGMSDNWMTLAKQFGENGFTTYAVDLRNHGQSPHSDEFSYELMVEDVVELMNDLKKMDDGRWKMEDAASIIGHSMGAKVAMLLALNHPEKINKLIAVDMAPRYYPPHHQYIFAAIHALGDLSAYSSRKEVEQRLSVFIPYESTLQFLLKNLYWSKGLRTPSEQKTNGSEHLAWRFNLPVLERHIEDRHITLNSSLPFNKPTLFIKGEKSNYITAEDEKEILNLFPHAQFKTISGAGHWVHADKPKEFFEMAVAFLKSK